MRFCWAGSASELTENPDYHAKATAQIVAANAAKQATAGLPPGGWDAPLQRMAITALPRNLSRIGVGLVKPFSQAAELVIRKLKDEALLKGGRIPAGGLVKRTLSQAPSACHIRTMKTVTLGQAKTKLQALLRLVAAGEEVEIVENRRPVARLVPPPPDTVDWSETFTKLEEIWGKEPLPGVPGSELVSQGRR